MSLKFLIHRLCDVRSWCHLSVALTVTISVSGCYRAVLEAKARAYDRLQTGTDALEDDATNERFLVNFQQKAIDDVTRRRQRRQAAAEGSSAEPPPQPDPVTAEEDQW